MWGVVPLDVWGAPAFFGKSEQASARAMFEALENHRLYAPRVPDDNQAREVFDDFMGELDPQRLLLSAPEVEALRPSSRAVFAAARGKDLSPVAHAFEQYQALALARLVQANALLETGSGWRLPETLPQAGEQTHWQASDSQVMERWRQTLKRRWLDLAAAGDGDETIRKHLRSEVAGLEQRVKGLSSDVVLATYLNAFTQSFDPHSSFMSAPRATRLSGLLGDSEPTSGPVQRLKSVVWEVDGQRVGLLRFPSFYADMGPSSGGNTSSLTLDVSRALKGFQAQGVSAVVVDLRGNGGGLIQQAVELAGLFLDRGTVAKIRWANGAEQDLVDVRPGMVWSGPLGVLVDQSTASASEIFAAAMQDWGRGIVVGERTFGKGTGQSFVRVPAGEAQAGLTLTSLQLFRVTGASTQQVGVVPDVPFLVSLFSASDREDQLRRAIPFARLETGMAARAAPWTERVPQLVRQHQQRLVEVKALGDWERDVQAYRQFQESPRRIQSVQSAIWEREMRDRAGALRKAWLTPSGDFLALEAARIVLEAQQ